jgi:hypothetical protein
MLIPVLNRDTQWLRQWVDQRASVPAVQKRLVLVVVAIALLLDNMRKNCKKKSIKIWKNKIKIICKKIIKI